MEFLRAHPEAQLLERAFAGEAYVNGDLVFADEVGGPIYPQRLTEAFLAHRKVAGLTTGTLHILRAHARPLALTNGIPCTLSLRASAIARRRSCASTRICCRSRMSRHLSTWRR